MIVHKLCILQSADLGAMLISVFLPCSALPTVIVVDLLDVGQWLSPLRRRRDVIPANKDGCWYC